MIVEIAGGTGAGKTSALIGLAMDARRTAEVRKGKGEEGGGGEVLIVGELRFKLIISALWTMLTLVTPL